MNDGISCNLHVRDAADSEQVDPADIAVLTLCFPEK
jgi:hypothetical protein